MSLPLTGAGPSAGVARYIDTFDSLSGDWTLLAGTLAVSGGGLRAATYEDWLNNLVTNPEFTTDTTGWRDDDGIGSQVDSTVDPGVTSPGADVGVLKTVLPTDGTMTVNQSYLDWPLMLHATYRGSVWCYVPTASPSSPNFFWYRGSGASYTVADRDTWVYRSATGAPTTTGHVFNLRFWGGLAGATAYWDQAEAYRRNAAAYLSTWTSANFVATLQHRSPAAAVTPFGWLFRRTDDLNYWELRVLPNTAGNDLQIIQVTAGAETVRAEADIDWTADDVDEIELTVDGQNISTRHKKSGEGSWTAGPSYASASQGETEVGLGPLFYGIDQNRLDRVEVVAL